MLQSNIKNPDVIIEYNNLGENEYDDWPNGLAAVMETCPKI